MFGRFQWHKWFRIGTTGNFSPAIVFGDYIINVSDPASIAMLNASVVPEVVQAELELTILRVSNRLAANPIPLRGKVIKGVIDPSLPPSVSIEIAQRSIRATIRQVAGSRFGEQQVDARLALIDHRSRLVRNIGARMRSSKEPCVLLGDPGSGKTHVLAQIGASLAESERKKKQPSLVIYFRGGGYAPSFPATVDGFAAAVASTLGHINGDAFAYLLRKGRLILLIDGLDEMPRSDYHLRIAAISEFATRAQPLGNRCLLSCRIDDFSPRLSHRRMVITPLTVSQIKAYLRKYFDSNEVEVAGKNLPLKSLVWEICRPGFIVDAANPQSLALVAGHLRYNKILPINRAELLADFFRRTLNQKDNEACDSTDPAIQDAWWESCSAAWSALSYTLTSTKDAGEAATVELIDQAAETIGKRPEDFGKAIAAGVRAGILVQDKPDGPVAFTHHRYQEYFTAKHIVSCRPVIDWKSLIESQRWQEILLLTVALDGISVGLEQLLPKPAMLDWKDPSLVEESAMSDGIALLARVADTVGRRGDPEADSLMRNARICVAQGLELGNPVTQLQMLRAFSYLKDAPISMLATALRSQNTTVAAQAMIVRSDFSQFVLDRSVSAYEDLLLDLSLGTLPLRLNAYWKSARGAGNLRAYVLPIVACVCMLPSALLSLSFAIGMFASASRQHLKYFDSTWLTPFYESVWSIVAMAFVALITYSVTWRDTKWRQFAPIVVVLFLTHVPLLLCGVVLLQLLPALLICLTVLCTYWVITLFVDIIGCYDGFMFSILTGNIFRAPVRSSKIIMIRRVNANGDPMREQPSEASWPVLVWCIFWAMPTVVIIVIYSGELDKVQEITEKYLSITVGYVGALVVYASAIILTVFMASLPIAFYSKIEREVRWTAMVGLPIMAVVVGMAAVFAKSGPEIYSVIPKISGTSWNLVIYGLFGVVAIGLVALAVSLIRRAYRAVPVHRGSDLPMPQSIGEWTQVILTCNDPVQQRRLIESVISLGTPAQVRDALEDVRSHVHEDAKQAFYEVWGKVSSALRQERR